MSVLAPWHHGAPAGDVRGQERLNTRSWWFGYAACLGLACVVGLIAYKSAQQMFAPAGVVVLIGVIVCAVRPVWGVYLTVALAMLGDASIFPSYPFTKNLSSPESVLYVADGLSISPLDLFIGALAFGWVVKMLATRTWTLYRGRLLVPLSVFTVFLVVGLGWGIGRGGSTLVAYWEIRPLLYLVALFVLVTNLLDRPEQYRRLLWMIMVVLTLNSLAALFEYQSLTAEQREALESLGEHGAAVQGAALIVFTFATLLFRQHGTVGRWLLVVMAVPVTWALLLSQRRAAMVALFAGLAVVMIVLRWHHRYRFRLVLPVLVIVLAGYLGAFWNATGALGLPAAAAKSVISTEQQTEQDRASDFYRTIEEFNIITTIRANPATGVGFGQKFYMPWPLPNISFFVFWEYITHNSILWIWMKAGIGGLIALLTVFATALRAGARVLRTSTDEAERTVTLTSVAFVLMFAIFAYVDIAWDTRNVVLLAVCLAQIDRAAGPVRRARRRSIVADEAQPRSVEPAPASPPVLVRAT